MKRSLENKKGFTLIELIVAMGLFAIILTAFTSFFLNAYKLESTYVGKADLNQEARLVSEVFARYAREAKTVTLSGDCTSGLSCQPSFVLPRGDSDTAVINVQFDGSATAGTPSHRTLNLGVNSSQAYNFLSNNIALGSLRIHQQTDVYPKILEYNFTLQKIVNGVPSTASGDQIYFSGVINMRNEQ